MYQEQRLEEILDLLEQRGQLTAKEMVDHFQVSKDTIRRDFSLLSQRGLAKRTHGGLLPLQQQPILGYLDRKEKQSQQKAAMAQLALALIGEGDFLFLDVSTTVSHLAQQLEKTTTVYSHSLDNAILFSRKEAGIFHLLGGRFHPKNRFYYSKEASDLLAGIRFDTAFFGAASLADGLIAFEDQEDVLIKKAAWQAARCKVLLAETQKLDLQSRYILGKLQELDYWICDQKPPQEILDGLAGHVIVLYPGKEDDHERHESNHQ